MATTKINLVCLLAVCGAIFLISGCDFAQQNLTGVGLHDADPPDLSVLDIPDNEWQVVKVGKWRQSKYDKKFNQECRDVEKKHPKTPLIQSTSECRPKPPK